MDPLFPVVLDAVAPHGEPPFDLGVVGQAFVGPESCPLVVFGLGVLGLLGQRHVRILGNQGRIEELLLEPLQTGQIRPDRHHADIGLVAQHRERDGLMVVGFEGRDRIDDAFDAARFVAPGAIHPKVQVEHSPPDRRDHRFQGHVGRLPARHPSTRAE